ncbi:MAG TPA: hypothetical protein VGL04_01055 [Sporichthyaceae bacterium]
MSVPSLVVVAAVALVLLASCGGAAGPRGAAELPPDLGGVLSGQLDCAGSALVTIRQHRYDFTGDGVPDALVAVRCDAGAGAPPSAVFAVAATKAGPRVVDELLTPDAGEVVSELTGIGPTAVVTTFAYSPDAPRCCPDLAATHTYHWDGAEFDAGTRVATPLPSTAPGDG